MPLCVATKRTGMFVKAQSVRICSTHMRPRYEAKVKT
jgi:hypothetical protein